MAETTNERIDELLRRERAFEDAESALEVARAAIYDDLSAKCLLLAKRLGVETARDFKDVRIERKPDSRVRIWWSEYHQYEVYDTVWVELLSAFLDLTDAEFAEQIDAIATSGSQTHSDCLEAKQKRERENEEKDRREFARLQEKYATEREP